MDKVEWIVLHNVIIYYLYLVNTGTNGNHNVKWYGGMVVRLQIHINDRTFLHFTDVYLYRNVLS
jgi:hypothetical protein